MTVTREQWLASELAKAPGKSREARVAIDQSLLQQAAVSSELLTGHPAWDVYLQRLQVQRDTAVRELEEWCAKIAGAYEDADLRVIQMQVNILRTKYEVLTFCMDLPKDILTHAADTLDKPAQ